MQIYIGIDCFVISFLAMTLGDTYLSSLRAEHGNLKYNEMIDCFVTPFLSGDGHSSFFAAGDGKYHCVAL